MNIPLKISSSKDLNKSCLVHIINKVEDEILNIANDPQFKKSRHVDNVIILDFPWRHIIPDEWFIVADQSGAQIEVRVKPHSTEIILTIKEEA